MSIIVRALDALGLALAKHDHVWSSNERQLYEGAISFEFRRDSDLSVSGKSLPATPWIERLPVCVAASEPQRE